MKIIWKEEKGVALLMVMGSLAILMAIMASFTFETGVNKLRVYNKQDMVTAQLMAESGLNISLARLKMYQEAINILEKDEAKRKILTPPLLNQVWSVPFIYPVPLPPGANIIQRTALEDFEKNSLLKGKMRVEIQNVSHLINVNLLRVAPKPLKLPRGPDDNGVTDIDEPNGEVDPAEGILTVQEKLTELLDQKLEEKKEKEEDYDAIYGSTPAALLIKELKLYVSEKESYSDPDNTEIESLYSEETIKHGPLSSLSELYLLKGWKDAHIDLIKSDITVHGNKTIDVNKITKTGLKLIIPDINTDQIKEFFKYRDGPGKTHYFSSFKEFSDYVVNEAKFIEQNAFDKRIEQFRKAGIEFGATGSLFKVTSVGVFEKANYTLTAFVSIPAEEPEPKPKKRPNDEGLCPQGYELDPKNKDVCLPKVEKDADGKPKKPPVTFLEPRVVELIVN